LALYSVRTIISTEKGAVSPPKSSCAAGGLNRSYSSLFTNARCSHISIVQRHSKAAVIFYALSLDFTYHLQREALILLTTYARSAYFTYYLQREALILLTTYSAKRLFYLLLTREALILLTTYSAKRLFYLR
jgi:hypothetical protein